MDITVEHNPTPERLEERGVFGWPVWTKEVSEFPWFYDEPEVCYFLEGEIEVTPEGGDPVFRRVRITPGLTLNLSKSGGACGRI